MKKVLLPRNLVALLQLSSRCNVIIFVVCPFLTVLWVGVQCLTFSGHTYLHIKERVVRITISSLELFKDEVIVMPWFVRLYVEIIHEL